ncbi:MAG: hypothetical protein V5A43_05470 [Haloarculaceae archaeon]
MSDEFAKGFGILATAGVAWMILAGWFNTPSFEGAQLTGPNPEAVGTYGELALLLKDALFWFAIFGALTFWVVIPLIEEARTALAE